MRADIGLAPIIEAKLPIAWKRPQDRPGRYAPQAMRPMTQHKIDAARQIVDEPPARMHLSRPQPVARPRGDEQPARNEDTVDLAQDGPKVLGRNIFEDAVARDHVERAVRKRQGLAVGKGMKP